MISVSRRPSADLGLPVSRSQSQGNQIKPPFWPLKAMGNRSIHREPQGGQDSNGGHHQLFFKKIVKFNLKGVLVNLKSRPPFSGN